MELGRALEKILPWIQTPLIGSTSTATMKRGWFSQGLLLQTMPEANAHFPLNPLYFQVHFYDQYYQKVLCLGGSFSELGSNVNLPCDSSVV